jgi:hypothetical protein
MALTAEQQAALDAQMAAQVTMESGRRAHELAIDARRTKLEAVRIAQTTLIENRRNQPADAREVTAADITAYANTLVSYING